jgi:hypothetical protein
MDGSKTCFAARVNSGLLRRLHGYNILPGASFTVKDWDMILLAHDADKPIMNRLVMFVKDFEWQTAPSINTFRYPKMAASDEWTMDTFQKALFDFDVVCDVETFKCIRMFNWCVNKSTKQWNYAELAETGVKHGYWIRHTETKRMWKNQLDGRKKAAVVLPVGNTVDNMVGCTCLAQYDLRSCVLQCYPLAKVCKEDLYSQVLERVGTENIDATEYDSFKPNHKRWSLYWFYSANIFNHRKSKRYPLPPCFVKAVREAFPDPTGTCYTGLRRNRQEFEHVPGTTVHKRFKAMYDDTDSSSDSESD